MNSTYSRCIYLFLVVLLCFSACKPSPVAFGEKANPKYSIYIMGKDGKEYLTETNSLDSGVILPEQTGAELDVRLIDRSIIVRNGYYYHYDRKGASFVKYILEGRNLNVVFTMPLKQFSIENYRWLGGDTLLLTGLSSPDFSHVKYVLLHSVNMKKLAEGDMQIPAPSGRFDSMSIGFVKPQQGNKLLVGYTYHQQLSASDYTTSDTTYISALNFPSMSLSSSTKDTRSTYPGGINTVQSSSFIDEQQDYYFMDCPGIALGNRPELPTAIMRINAGEKKTDPDYFLNFSAAAGNHAYGMWYLGNHKAVVRAERKDLYRGLGDHYSTPHFEFYIVDLQTSAIKKLALPLDKGTRRECVLVHNEQAYISVNSSTEGNFIWIYNIRTGSLKKGLELAGNTDFILRMDKLH